MALQSAQTLNQSGSILRIIGALSSLFTNAGPSLLDTDVGERGFEAGELDDTVFASCAGGDGVEGGEFDYFADEEFAEEFAGVEAICLSMISISIALRRCSPSTWKATFHRPPDKANTTAQWSPEESRLTSSPSRRSLGADT